MAISVGGKGRKEIRGKDFPEKKVLDEEIKQNTKNETKSTSDLGEKNENKEYSLGNQYSLGNPNGYVYFDAELTELNLGAEIVKVSLISQTGSFFGCITEDNEMKKHNYMDGKLWIVYGTKKELSFQINLWINEYMNSGVTQCIQFVCNSGVYKFPALIDLITNGEGIRALKSWITPVYYELTIDIANSISVLNPNMAEYPLQTAFVLDKRKLLYTIKDKNFVIKTDEKVMNDAVITSIIHRFIWGLE